MQRSSFITKIAKRTWVRSYSTIYALSSAPGKAGVAVIRVSGPQAKKALTETVRGTTPLEPRQAYFRRIRHPVTNMLLDRGLVFWFPGPNSFTGEDSVEFHVHGGNAVVKSVLEALGSLDQFRLAEQGEFSKRAFDNDKLDLTEIEGLADLLNAETEAQRQLALRQAEGGLRKPYEEWRNKIIQCMAVTEAVIDFGEDEHIEDGVLDQVLDNVIELRDAIQYHLNDSRVGEIVRSGVRVAIVGPPNAGKSTLLNLLAKREAAIVSDTPGTTRDIVEVTLNLGGYPVVISDTAGLRKSNDNIEMEGVKRAMSRMDLADIKICLLPLTQNEIDPIVQQVLDPDTFVILTKQDLVTTPNCSNNTTTLLEKSILDQLQKKGVQKIWTLSCKTGQGVDRFLNDMIDVLKSTFDDALASPALITQARHRQHLQDCLVGLENYLALPQDEVVLGAEELRYAANALGRITGRVDVEDVLDVLFSQFCIGK
ncbi:tRNA modification GTPase TrmE [Phascolomyces articulosus]|uniref:tRNA modification GTPase TrmE n=1 Tax=Phascolomyces articulosus TaxID=60185 RepID=A0AAD5KHY3_9FUNG|nr:tRNA modification GTPase TrmE [Phascolomyces articulosus]